MRRANPRFQIFSERRKLFSKHQAVAQLDCRCLPRSDLLGRGRRQQPSGQGFLPGTGARSAQQLEKRGSAKQVEIARVRVCRLQEAFAAGSASRPTPVDARQPSLIKPDATGAIRYCTEQPAV